MSKKTREKVFKIHRLPHYAGWEVRDKENRVVIVGGDLKEVMDRLAHRYSDEYVYSDDDVGFRCITSWRMKNLFVTIEQEGFDNKDG